MEWWQIGIVLAGLVLFPYWGGPFIIKALMQMRLNPEVFEISPSDPNLPKPAADLWTRVHPGMTALGFEFFGTAWIREITPKSMIYAAFYAHPKTHERFMAAYFVTQTAGQTNQQQVCEFCAHFADESTLGVNNSKIANVTRPSSRSFYVRFPKIMEVGELHRMFRAALAHRKKGAPEPLESEDWWRTSIERSLQYFARSAKEQKLMHEPTSNQLCLTWWGAFISTYRNLPPGKWMIEKQDRMLAEEIARSAA